MARRMAFGLFGALLIVAALIALGGGWSARRQTRDRFDELGRQNAQLGADMTRCVIEEALADGVVDAVALFSADHARVGEAEPARYRSGYGPDLERDLSTLYDAFLNAKPIAYAYCITLDGYVPLHSDSSKSGIRLDKKRSAAARVTEPVAARRDGDGRDFYEYSAPIFIRERRWGEFRVGVPVTLVRSTVLAHVAAAVAGSCLIAAVLGTLAYVAVRGRLRPLGELTAAATAMAGGDLSVRCTPTRHDEMGELCQAFNEMAEAVEACSREERERRGKLEALFDGIDDFVFLLDAEGRILETNRLGHERLGYGPDDLRGQSVLKVHPPERQDEAAAVMADVLAGKISLCAVPLMTREGKEIPVETRVTAVKWNDESLLLELSRDVTQRRRLGADTVPAGIERAAILDSMSEHVICQDDDHKILWANRAACDAVGLSQAEIEGRACHEVWAGRDTACPGCPVAETRLTGTPHEAEITAPDGRTRLVRGYPLTDDEGQTVAIVEVTRDVTERKRMNEALSEARDCLELRVEERTRELAKANEQLLARITECRQAEDALRQSEQNYRSIFDAVSEAVLVCDSEMGAIIDVNSRASELFGYTPQEALRLDIGAISSGEHPYTQEEAVRHVQKAASGEPQLLEWACKDKAGRVFWSEVHLKRSTIAGQDRVVAVIRDIDQRRRTEDELLRAKERAEGAAEELALTRVAIEKNANELSEALSQVELQRHQAQTARRQAEEANRLVKSMLASVSSIAIALDRQGRVTHWNAAAEKVLGVPAETALGREVSACGIPWENADVVDTIRACGDSSEAVRLEEMHFTRPDMTAGLLSLAVSPMIDEQGRNAGFVLLGDDVSERAVLGQELQLSQRLESVGALAAGIAHEINTPIQFVGDTTRFLSDSFAGLRRVLSIYRELRQTAERHGFAPDIVQRVSQTEDGTDLAYLDEEIPRAIVQALDSVGRVARIVRAMKGFSRPDQDEKAPTNLNDALSDALVMARNELKYVADVVTDFDPQLPAVPCHASDLGQVFLTLLVSAAQAIADVVGDGKNGRVPERGTITVTTRCEGDEIVIRVTDTGTGIPPETRHRLVEQSLTTRPVGKGMRQHLATARSIVVDRHGGSLTFETEVGKGTTSTIRLPLEPADIGSQPAARPT